jgi:hypothetical protein
MPYLVIEDIISTCVRGHIYTERFDEISIVAAYHHVFIAQNNKGERFPVVKDKVIELSNEEMKAVKQCNSVIKEINARQSTPANMQRLRVQEQKLKQIITI